MYAAYNCSSLAQPLFQVIYLFIYVFSHTVASCEQLPWSPWFVLDLGAMLVSQIGDRKLQLRSLSESLDALASETAELMSGELDTRARLGCLRAVLCERNGFGDASRTASISYLPESSVHVFLLSLF